MAYRLKESIGDPVDYLVNTAGPWKRSRIERAILSELLRRKDWEPVEGGSYIGTDGMRVPMAFVEEAAAW